ncbi:MAG: peptide chain release factor 2 [Alphaproteobacteria bacterium]|nr:peptide chain release factor 2 [Alphaproteobacteria bacterium]MDA8009696.1 peptide chain release factor 2 [Alphaproteobacteria bacterium]
MKAEIKKISDDLDRSLNLLRGRLDADKVAARLETLRRKSAADDFWNDNTAAAKVLREQNLLENRVNTLQKLGSDREDALTLLELGEGENDADTVSEAETLLATLADTARRKALEAMLSGEADSQDCYLEVNAGAGGTEAQDWADMLQRMYRRWAEDKNFKVETLHESAGEEAGIKSATLRITGNYAFGWLRAESGVHRLVRISPFDAGKRRHTSFASVAAWPVVDDDIEIDVQEKDLRVDTYRASGAGGQHVNRTDSAVRVTHIPSGIVAQCQSDRSQHRNRATAMAMLKARLYEAELRKRQEAAQSEADSRSDISWGHQIRSYVMQPYRLVKDTRTGFESSQVDSVLDGDIDAFLEAALARTG